MKSVGSVSFGTVCCGCCLTILVLGTATVRVTVFVSGLAIFFANATRLLLVLNINSSFDAFTFFLVACTPLVRSVNLDSSSA